KFWFVYHAKAIVVMPGGFGTMDELMEMLTLEQTNVISKKVPIVLFGKEFWNNLINFDYLLEVGMISEKDLDLFVILDDIDEAFDYVVKGISKLIRVEE
ncbi:MAG: LOG family protein, partial [Candidatus Kapaibacterium sp.]